MRKRPVIFGEHILAEALVLVINPSGLPAVIKAISLICELVIVQEPIQTVWSRVERRPWIREDDRVIFGSLPHNCPGNLPTPAEAVSWIRCPSDNWHRVANENNKFDLLFTRSEHTGKTKVKSLLMNKNETKAAFAERLNRLCDESPLIREKNRGRNVDLAKHTGTRSETCRRWVEGLNYPEMKHIEKLCDLFDANIGWLLSGVGAPYRNDIADAGPTFRHGIRARFLPVLHPGEALTFEGDYSDIEPIYWYPTDLQVGAYWLEITDDSMNAGTGDTFRPGTIVLVNPEAEPGNNDLGIIHLPKWGEVLCRQFIKQGPERSAVAYNPNYPKVDANDPGVEIIGKVEDAVIRLMRGR